MDKWKNVKFYYLQDFFDVLFLFVLDFDVWTIFLFK